MDDGPAGFVVFCAGGNLFAGMYDRDMDIEAEGGEIKKKTEMKIKKNRPICFAFIEMEDDAGYYIMCDGVVYKETGGTFNSDILERLSEKHSL